METLLGGLLLGGFLAFNSFATPARAAKKAESALRQKFPGALVSVAIKGRRGRDVIGGRFKSITVELANARFDAFPLQPTATQIPARAPKTGSIGHLELRLRDLVFADPTTGDLTVKSALISFDHVRYDFGALKNHSEVRLISFSNGKIALSVEAASLLPTFRRRAPEIENPGVELRPGEAVFSGVRPFLGTSTSVIVRGPIVARGQNLELDGAHVEVGDAELSPALAAPILKGINPLYAFDPEGKWPLTLTIGRITTDKNTLALEGTLTLK